ncbi:MAG: PAS domain S-box protein [Desulfobacteraceae bacterium]|nr:PAS domain S-box protein [Desulfobacteraceae bacterium]
MRINLLKRGPVPVTGTQQDHHPDQRVPDQEKEPDKKIQQQALAFNYIYDGVILTDLDGWIIDWNHGAERMFGYTKAEIMGKSPGILHRPEEAPVLTQAIIDGMVEPCLSGCCTYSLLG